MVLLIFCTIRIHHLYGCNVVMITIIMAFYTSSIQWSILLNRESDTPLMLYLAAISRTVFCPTLDYFLHHLEIVYSADHAKIRVSKGCNKIVHMHEVTNLPA